MSWTARLGTIAALPSKLVEELSHAVAAWPWAERLALTIEPGDGTAATQAVLAEDTPRWGQWLVRHAPQIAGAVLGAIALWALASGVRPSNPLEVAGTIAAAWWWAKLVAPERAPDGGDDE
jgi:hypothetical protein